MHVLARAPVLIPLPDGMKNPTILLYASMPEYVFRNSLHDVLMVGGEGSL